MFGKEGMNLVGSIERSTAFSSRLATPRRDDVRRGTRGFLGSMRSYHTHVTPFSLPLFGTEKAKRSSASTVSGSESAICRTLFWSAKGASCLTMGGFQSVYDATSQATTSTTAVIAFLDECAAGCKRGFTRSRPAGAW